MKFNSRRSNILSTKGVVSTSQPLAAKAGADINSMAASGVSSLWLAAGEGHTEVIQYLLSKKADPNNQRSDGITALMAACAGGHDAIVKALVEAGADATAQVCTLLLTVTEL